MTYNYTDETISLVREYVRAVRRCEQTGTAWHDEKRQLAHDDLMENIARLNRGVNTADTQDRSEVTDWAMKSIRWFGL